MLSSFLGVLPILIRPLYALSLSCDKSAIPLLFALDLMSEYEREHMIFHLLGLANLTQNYVLPFQRLHSNSG
jgi:hypothetical protein